MCLTIGKTDKPIIAEEPILCFKNHGEIVNGDYHSTMYARYAYKIGVKQPEVDFKIFPDYWLERGLDYLADEARGIHEGYHTHSKAKRYGVNGVFVIPSGALYYKGTFGGLGYASNTLIYLGWYWSPMTWFRWFKYKSEWNTKK